MRPADADGCAGHYRAGHPPDLEDLAIRGAPMHGHRVDDGGLHAGAAGHKLLGIRRVPATAPFCR